ncbi:MAG: YdcF family protein [Magnetovibrio sp.]|nr:YdcF family protein [Magnetovibrio sp.]
MAGKAVPNGNYSYRLQRAIDLQPRPVLILGGFTHADSPCSEAAAGRDWLIAQGVNEALIFTEDKSTNTLENLYGVQKFVTDHGFDVPCLISNRFHLARCSLMAQGLGIEHHLCAAEASFEWSLKNIATVMLEAFFINAYWVGRWVSKIFKHKGILGRISSRCQNDND